VELLGWFASLDDKVERDDVGFKSFKFGSGAASHAGG
jgi:hypothetical protein